MLGTAAEAAVFFQYAIGAFAQFQKVFGEEAGVTFVLFRLIL
jgi:hypothetical protein